MLPRLRELYDRTWYVNELQLRAMRTLLAAFQRAGIATLILKGAALALRYHGDLGVRPMGDIDVLVPTAQAPAAMDMLQSAGWVGPPVPRDRLLRRQHSAGFRGPEGWECDLHWHITMDLVLPDAPDRSSDDFWEASDSLAIGDVTTRTLDRADHLLHVCLHGGARWYPPHANVMWVADATALLGPAAGELDWGRLVSRATRHRVSALLVGPLTYLATAFRAPVPREVLRDLGAVRLSRRDRFVAWTCRRRTRVLGAAWSGLATYARLSSTWGPLSTVVRLPHFLQDWWNLDHVWEVPLHALKQGIVRGVGSARDRNRPRGI